MLDKWIFKPKNYEVTKDKIVIETEPHTDFWQRTYYGFRNDNAHALVKLTNEKYFSFIAKVEYEGKMRYDQAGVLIYQNCDNWFKASVEYGDEVYGQLGSVVTNNGYSDWAFVDIPFGCKCMYYRLSRRESDFLIEYSYDGENFKQMRIFHLSEGSSDIQFGIYACSPLESSFKATFSEVKFSECVWQAFD